MAESTRTQDQKYDQKIKHANEAVAFLKLVHQLARLYSKTVNRPVYPDLLAYVMTVSVISDATEDTEIDEGFADVVAEDFMAWLIASGDMIVADSYDEFWDETRDLVAQTIEVFLTKKAGNESPAS